MTLGGRSVTDSGIGLGGPDDFSAEVPAVGAERERQQPRLAEQVLGLVTRYGTGRDRPGGLSRS